MLCAVVSVENKKKILLKTKNSALQSWLRGMGRRDGAGTTKALSLAVESEVSSERKSL